MDPAHQPITIPQSSWHPLNRKTKKSNRPSSSPICPKGIARLHFELIQPRHLRPNGLFFITGSPRQHFANQNQNQDGDRKNYQRNRAVEQKSNSPRRRSDNFTTHEARLSSTTSARSRLER